MGKRVICRLSRHYGVDLTGKEKSRHFASLSGMMHVPSAEGDALVRAVGYRRICALNSRVHGMISADGGKTLLIHAGRRLYTLDTEALPSLPTIHEALSRRHTGSPATPLRMIGKDQNGKSSYVTNYLPDRNVPHAALGSAVYLLTGTHILRYEDGALSVIADETNPMQVDGLTVTDCTSPYVPLVLENGATCEQRNLLTDLFRVTADLETGASNDHSGPFTYERTDNGDSAVPTCRVLAYTGESPLSFLVIPESAVIDGVHCAITDIAPSALAGSGVRSLALPASMKALATTEPLEGIEDLRSLYLPYGIFLLTQESLKNAPDHMRIYYAGTKEEWKEVSLVPGDGSYAPSVFTGTTSAYRALTVDLPRDARTLECLSLTLNGVKHESSASDVAYSFLSDGEGGIRALYLLVYSEIPLTNMQIGMTLRSAPYAYEDGDSGARHPLLRGSETKTEARALAMSAEVLAAYDQRLFFGAPSAAKDAIFYTHTDRSGRMAPHYLAAENYATDPTSGGVSGIFSAEGDLLILRTSEDTRQSTLSACEGVTPEAGTALFRRVYPTVRQASLPTVKYAFVSGGGLHLLTENGLFGVTRQTSGGYFSLRHLSERIDPLLLAQKDGYMHASLEGLLLLSAGTHMLIGDFLRTDGSGYEWYPLGSISDFGSDTLHFVSMTELPYGEAYGYVASPGGSVAPLGISESQVSVSGFGVEFLDVCKADGTPHPQRVTIPCIMGSRCYLPMSSDGVFTGGNARAISALCSVKNLTFLASEAGGIFLFNTDLDRKNEKTYQSDCHETVAHLETFPFDAGELHKKKRTESRTAYLTVGKDATEISVTVIKDGVPEKQAQKTGACCFDFESLDFSRLAFGHLHPSPIPLFENARDYYEKSYRIESAHHLSFREIGFTADLRERGKIL